MKRKWQVFFSVICIAVLCSSCSGAAEPAKKPSGNENTKEDAKQGNLDVLTPVAYSDASGIDLEPGSYISIIGKNNESEFWKEVEAGAQKAAEDLNEELGYKGEDKIKVNFSGPSKGENVEDQINILDEELARNPAAVGIAIIDSNACGVQFDLAAENGIPIIAFDSGSDYKGIEAMCSADNMAIGKMGAMKLASAMKEQGEAAVFVHDKESTSGKLREESFVKEMQEKYPQMTIPVVYHMDDLEEMAKVIAEERNAEKKEGEEGILAEDITQAEAIAYLLEKNPNIKGCFTTNAETTQQLLEVLEETDKEDMAVIAVDGGAEQMKALEDGRVNGLIVQNPYGMGYAAVIAASRASLGMGNEAFVDTGFIWVTKENLNDENIAGMLY